MRSTGTLNAPSVALDAPADLDALTIRDVFPISVALYEKLGRSGDLTPDDNVELIYGRIVKKPMKNEAHTLVLGLLSDWLKDNLPAGWFAASESPILLDSSMPEPDMTVVRGSRRDYAERRFTPSDIGLLVEVADSTLTGDRGIKLHMYAEAGIVAYWIINIPDRQIEAYTQPRIEQNGTARYATQTMYTADDSLPLLLDGAAIAAIRVADLLP